jgi:hypothetical protein
LRSRPFPYVLKHIAVPPSKTVKQSTKKIDDNRSMTFTQSLPMPVYKALAKFTRDKGFDSEQAVLRVWALRCLEAAGYWPVR